MVSRVMYASLRPRRSPSRWYSSPPKGGMSLSPPSVARDETVEAHRLSPCAWSALTLSGQWGWGRGRGPCGGALRSRVPTWSSGLGPPLTRRPSTCFHLPPRPGRACCQALWRGCGLRSPAATDRAVVLLLGLSFFTWEMGVNGDFLVSPALALRGGDMVVHLDQRRPPPFLGPSELPQRSQGLGPGGHPSRGTGWYLQLTWAIFRETVQKTKYEPGSCELLRPKSCTTAVTHPPTNSSI